MKIKVWQQFSANHSGRYSVVGIFDTPQDAKEAAKLIGSTLGEWAIQKTEPYVADNYTSWLFSAEPPESVIYYFDRLLMIGSGLHETWDPVAPILDLLHLLTVDTAYHYSESVVLYVTILCVAPNDDVSGQLFDAVNIYLRSKRSSKNPPPWQVDPNTFVDAYGTIEQQDETLLMQLEFFFPSEGLPPLLAYLSKYGCTDFDFDIIDSNDPNFQWQD